MPDEERTAFDNPKYKSGGGGLFRFIGDEGVITARGRSLTVSRSPRRRPPDEAVFKGYNSVRTFSEAQQKAFVEQYKEEFPAPDLSGTAETSEFQVPQGYDSRLDHFTYFFDAIRNDTRAYQDVVYGYRAAAPSLLCNMSYVEEQILYWDPEGMRLKT